MCKKDLGLVLFLAAVLLGWTAPAWAGCSCTGSYSVSAGVGQLGNDCNSARNLLITDLNNAAKSQCTSIIAGSTPCQVSQSIGTCTYTSTQVNIQGWESFGCWICTPKNP